MAREIVTGQKSHYQKTLGPDAEIDDAEPEERHRILVANATLILHHHHGSLISAFALLSSIFAQWWRSDISPRRNGDKIKSCACHADLQTTERFPELLFSQIMTVSLAEGYNYNGRR